MAEIQTGALETGLSTDKSEQRKTVFFLMVFALAFYVGGASFVESFVNYPTWHLIGSENFREYHNALSSLIIKVLVAPWLIEILLTFCLLWYRPRKVTTIAIAIALFLNLIGVISTITIQLPIQMRFDARGFSASDLDDLIKTDPIRWIALILKEALFVWMMIRTINGKNGLTEPPVEMRLQP